MDCDINLDTLRENWGEHPGRACLFVSDREYDFYDWPQQAEELREAIILKNSTGSAYVGWCLFSSDQRTSDKALVVPGVLLDVDVKTGEHAADDYAESEEEALDLLRRSGLPEPTRIIHSGGGLYAHYQFTEPFVIRDERDRRRVSLVLKCLTREAVASFRATGRRLDNVSDLARITRPEGTVNWKYSHRPIVEAITSGGPRYPIESLEAIIGLGTSWEEYNSPSSGPDGDEEAKGDYTLVEQFCCFAAHQKRNPSDVTEPEWYAAATIAARCKGGPKHFHATSALDADRYDRSETDRKLANARRAKPRTCSSIENDLGYQGCKRCPFRAGRFRSPYALAVGNPQLLQLQRDYVLSTDTDQYTCITRDEPWLAEKSFNNQFGDVVEKPHKLFVQDKRSPKVKAVDYVPGDENLIVEHDDGVRVLNTWKRGGVEAVAGTHDILLAHLQLLVPHKEHLSYFLNGLAHLLQKPSTKINHATVMIGSHGVGKSFLNELLSRLFGDHNVFVDDAQIHATANRRPMGNKQILIIEEMATNAKWEVGNALKPWFTSDTTQAEDKYIRSHRVRTPRGIFIWTNHNIPTVLEQGDRRYFVVKIDSSPQTEEYYTRLWEDGLPQAAGFKQMLLDREIAHWSPKKNPPMTDAKLDILEASRTPFAAEIRAMVDNGSIDRDLVKLEDLEYRVRIKCPSAGLLRTQVLKALHELKYAKTDKTKLSDKKGYALWAVRIIDHWRKATHAERRAHYEGVVPERGTVVSIVPAQATN